MTDLATLSEVLRNPDWYGRKDTAIDKVEVVEEAVLEQEAEKQYVLALSEVAVEFGPPELYVVPLIVVPGVRPADARLDPSFNRVLFQIIQHRRFVPIARGTLEGERADSTLLDQVPETAGIRPIDGEQTNTSSVIGDKVILKVLRKVEQGLNPEWEIEQFLHRRGFRAMPELLGAIKVHGTRELTVALAHEFIPAESDGWRYALDSLSARREPIGAFLKKTRGLGERLGELHRALGSDSADPAFSPELIQSEDLQRWSSSIIGELGVTIQMASRAFPNLIKIRDPLVERVRALAHLEPSGQKIRVHGDLHLGQILSYRGDWLIFDFEGEPGRTYAQRREKQSPLKDVAGMLRSFSYAYGVARSSGQAGPKLEQIHSAFLEGYRSILEGSALLPSSESTFRGLLDALELEKLLYELRYELAHRPDWVHIPAQSLMQLEVSP